jgi:hypothetical protein
MPLPTEEKSSVTGHLNYSDRRDTEEEAPDSAVYISSRRGILDLVKFSQAPFSLCPYPVLGVPNGYQLVTLTVYFLSGVARLN